MRHTSTDRNVMREKPFLTKPSQGNSAQVLAREKDVTRAEAINALLTRPIAILPAKVGDPIRPFALGLWNEIRCLLKEEISVSTLRKATGRYVHSRSYQTAVARPRSSRHDISGAPVDIVSDADRLAAQQNYESLRTGRAADRTMSKAAPASLRSSPPLKAEMIRTALLSRNGIGSA